MSQHFDQTLEHQHAGGLHQAWVVVYSRRQHQKNIRQTSIKVREPRSENRAG
ncbi:MAG TPA: hypothetical protein VN228_10940 [Pyrinomonadaceae bacterium]|nr:hypothetical protein [Pyrinomonadaceae bacterium]